jgi:FtsH-binding integral membrane protein
MAVSEELIKLAARVVFQQVATPFRADLERRIVGAAIFGALALIVILAAVACGVTAFCLWLVPKLGAALAALVTMAALVVIALILALGAVAMARRRSPTPALNDLFDAKELSSLVEKHLPELLIAAAVGGLVFGMRRRK